MSEGKPCRPRTLAGSDVAHVQQCVDCGCISIHLGPFTVRTDATTLESLWSVVGEAATRLHAEALREGEGKPSHALS